METVLFSVILMIVLTGFMLLFVAIAQPSAISFFVAGLYGLSVGTFLMTPIMPRIMSGALDPRRAPCTFIVMLLISVVCFWIGARVSLKEAVSHAKLLRWANVVGLAISVSLLLVGIQASVLSTW